MHFRLFNLDAVLKTKLFLDVLENSVSLTDMHTKLENLQLKNNIIGKHKVFFLGYKGKR